MKEIFTKRSLQELRLFVFATPLHLSLFQQLSTEFSNQILQLRHQKAYIIL